MSRLEELEAMLEESPDDPFLIYALAREYESQQSTMQALLMYEHLVTNFPDYIATYYHYAKLLFGAGNRNAAIQLLEKGIESGNKNKEAHLVNEMKSLLTTWTFGEEED
jgi:tetratricopeptide (TPR) repeat protein